MGFLDKNRSKYAFSGRLDCPFCKAEHGERYRPEKQSWKLIQTVTPTLLRYRCKQCKRTIRYDISNNYNPSRQELLRKGLMT